MAQHLVTTLLQSRARIRRPCLCIVPLDELSILTHLSPHHVGGIAHLVSPWEGIVRPHFAIPSPSFFVPGGTVCTKGGNVISKNWRLAHTRHRSLKIIIALTYPRHNFSPLSILGDALKPRMRFWKRRAAKKSLQNAKKLQEGFFAPFFQLGHLRNGYFRMRGLWIVYHIIVFLSWFWVGIVRLPRFLNINFECRNLSCDFHQQRMLFFKFNRHFEHNFAFFWLLVRFHRSFRIRPRLNSIWKFYFYQNFTSIMVLACFDWVFQGDAF